MFDHSLAYYFPMIIMGSDHAAFELKNHLKLHLEKMGKQVEDVGVFNSETADYPPIARAVAEKVLAIPGARGILACGSGIGMSISANRLPQIRAALCGNVEMARLARAHNDANILVLAGRFMSREDALEAMVVFIETPFEGGRHARRGAAIDERQSLKL